MPELPEVETVRRSLLPLLAGKRLAQVKIMSPVVALPQAADFAVLEGAALQDIKRRGKYLVLQFDSGVKLTVHLRMTGRLVYQDRQEPYCKHTHAVFVFQDDLSGQPIKDIETGQSEENALDGFGGKELRFVDVRRFGRLWLGEPEEIGGFAALGPEPLDDDFSPEKLAHALKKHTKTKIKSAILDQTVVCGLGNIYADETLFLARIHPERLVHTLTAQEIEALAHAMRTVLLTAIANRGTSFRDYVDGLGEKGSNQNALQVFRRQGQPCPCCGETIHRVKVAGRSSFFCPCCQKPAE